MGRPAAIRLVTRPLTSGWSGLSFGGMARAREAGQAPRRLRPPLSHTVESVGKGLR